MNKHIISGFSGFRCASILVLGLVAGLGGCVAEVGSESESSDYEETESAADALLTVTSVGTTVTTTCSGTDCNGFARACDMLLGTAYSGRVEVTDCSPADTCVWTTGKTKCYMSTYQTCSNFINACQKGGGVPTASDIDPATNIPTSQTCTK